jgi:apolipoprotein D and lipocalin family protein
MNTIATLATLLLGICMVHQDEDASKRPLQVVPSIDFKRYCGRWYEIARLPAWFQKKCVSDVTALYSILEDGTIRVVNRCRTGTGEYIESEGKARRRSDDEPNSKLEVRFAPAILSFLPMVWGKYWVIDLAPDYSYAVVGEPDREYLWILSRTPTMTQETYDAITAKVREQGYDPANLIRTRQGE